MTMGALHLSSPVSQHMNCTQLDLLTWESWLLLLFQCNVNILVVPEKFPVLSKSCSRIAK